ncbi:MAG: sigma factor [bacterium]|nr:sigma factor [bacterium]
MDEYFNSCIGLIKSLAQQFYGVDKRELYHVGQIGLFKAYQNYDASSNVKFSSFAYMYIYGEMYKLSLQVKPVVPP